MEQRNDIEADQYDKINKLASRVEQLTGVVDVSNQLNSKLLTLLTKVLYGSFIIILCLVGALIFGAIGKDGLFAVRNSLPIPERQQQSQNIAIPWHSDLDRWFQNGRSRIAS